METARGRKEKGERQTGRQKETATDVRAYVRKGFKGWWSNRIAQHVEVESSEHSEGSGALVFVSALSSGRSAS